MPGPHSASTVTQRSVAIRCTLYLFLMTVLCIPAGATDLPAQIDTDMTLTTADSPWRLRSDVRIAAGAEVTVEPNVRILAHGDVRLTVHGSLKAMSEPGTRIVFRAAETDASGSWKGLYFREGSTGRFQRCTFRSGATNLVVDGADVRLYNCHLRRASQDGLLAFGDAFVKCAYCRFQNNGRHGLQILTDRPRGAVIFSEFLGNGEHPVRIKAPCMQMLRRGNTYDFNGVAAIGVDCDADPDIEDTDCWRDQDLPLDMTVGSPTAELTIAEGATLRIKSDIRIYPPHRIMVRGRLLIDGLTGAPVVIQPQGDAVPGAWQGIALDPGAVIRAKVATIGFAEDGLSVDDAELYLANVLIRDCARNGVFAGGSAHVDMAECTVSACGRNGVAIPQPTSTAKIHSTRIVESGDYPMRLAATVVEAQRHGNSWRGNARSAIGVVCSRATDIADDDLWLAQGIPFDLTADPTATTLHVGGSGRLSLRRGVEVLGGTLSAEGILVAAGTAEEPVILDAATAEPLPGDWTGVEYAPGSAGRLVHAVVRNAHTGINVQSDGWIQIRNTLVHRCLEDGICAGGEAVPLITGCEIRDNGRWGVSVFHNAEPLLGASGAANNPGGNTIVHNGEYDLANQTDHALLAQRNWWGTTSTQAAGARILDRSEDSSLGPVNFTPLLSAAPGGGVTAPSSAPVLAVVSVAAVPTGNGAAIHVSLTGRGDLCVTVRNIGGRVVQRITARDVQAQAVIPWDGQNLRGSRVPSGRYIVEVEAFAAEGGRSRALTTLQLNR